MKSSQFAHSRFFCVCMQLHSVRPQAVQIGIHPPAGAVEHITTYNIQPLRMNASAIELNLFENLVEHRQIVTYAAVDRRWPARYDVWLSAPLHIISRHSSSRVMHDS